MSENEPGGIIDVAIIGGGVAGIYSGWRLLSAELERSNRLGPLFRSGNGNLNVQLFEASDRIGGRLLSVAPPEMPGFRAEFGGMRFLNSQRLVGNLIKELGLATRPFPVGGPDNIYYLRGQHLRERDFAHPERVPYRLNWQERGKDPGRLIADALNLVVPGATGLAEAEWREIKEHYQFNGCHLYDLGFWNLLHQVMSHEAFELLIDAGGYNSTLANWNAAEAMYAYLVDFGPGVEYIGVPDGYEEVPLRIASRFVEASGKIHFSRKLVGIDREPGGGQPLVRLEFGDGAIQLARHVILAMPRRALELLGQQGGFLGSSDVHSLITSVKPHPMFKLFLCYRYPWWQRAGVEVGRSVTDLPLRQIYYFGSEVEGPVAHHRELRDSLVMGSYDDGPYVDFWLGLSEGSKTPGGAPIDIDRWSRFSCPADMVGHAQRQLKLVHELEYIPDPYAAAFMDWSQDPYGGGWNTWNIHVRPWEVMDRMVQPLADWPISICGEAYSNAQGWVEGALATAERAVREYFDLQPPEWMFR
jgi:monoamine oxidase